MIKVIFTGTESTGKTTLCRQISKYYNYPFVKEYSRDYLLKIDRKYNKQDLVEIAKKQIEFEKKYRNTKLLFCDTDLITLKIWSNYKYGNCDKFILKKIEEQNKEERLYLLCKPDIKWQDDSLREHPYQRQEIHNLYVTELKNYKKEFILISGQEDVRVSNAISAIKNIFPILNLFIFFIIL